MKSGYIDTIDKYLLNNLKVEEKEAFENLMKKHIEVKKAFEQRKEMVEYIQLMAEQTKKKQIASITVKEEDLIFEDETDIPQKRKISPYTYFAIAASLLFSIGVAFVFSNNNQNNYTALSKKYYKTYTVSQSRDAGHSNTGKNKEQAIEAYNNKAYQKAIPLLGSFKDDPELSLLMGIAYYETNQFENALQKFMSLLNKENILFQNEALWYAALSNLQLNQPGHAKAILQQIINNKHVNKKILKPAQLLFSEL